ncbi:MAG TPA: peptidoglycan editing factor PgeF [Bryobacteraceae bacterium]|nr:peptidoglycan editing factor PgeF [Bryobacteraceae bacterium]
MSSPHVLESKLLKQLPWLTHGFGTRQTRDWPGNYTHLKQVHGDNIVLADGAWGSIGEGDALISAHPGTLVGVRTADCVPVLLADTDLRAVAAVHAGWRGTVAEIVRKTVERMTAEFGSRPTSLLAAIGPSIGRCCFEVGPEVAKQFGVEGRTHIDLVASNFRLLTAAGVPAAQIEVADLCTVCDPLRFHSFRRDKEQSGRMVSAIGIVR